MIDYCCFASTLEGRICESTTHLHEFFEDEVTFSQDDRGHIRYVVSDGSSASLCHSQAQAPTASLFALFSVSFPDSAIRNLCCYRVWVRRPLRRRASASSSRRR
jgi:hypothetical protein